MYACDRRTDRQTDRQTDGRTDGRNYDSQDCAIIAASRGKNENKPICIRKIWKHIKSCFQGRIMRPVLGLVSTI